MSELKLRQINDGNLSLLALEFFDTVLSSHKAAILSRMTMDIRTGIVDNSKLIGYASAYTALEDLGKELVRLVNNGNRQQKEVIDNATRNPPNI